uniref:RDD family protein n=1 Tax=Arthrobacter sp. TaxID=1667 RepID=UPI00289AB5E4
MATNPNLVNATAGQRLAARAVDSVPLLVLALVVLSVPDQLPVILCAVAAAAYLLWLWLWEAGSGQTPGNRLLGLRTVGEDGLAPGFPAVLVRNLLLTVSAVTVVGPWILTVSNLWDHPHRRQGWHDKAARTLMVDIRAGRNPLATG